MSISLIIFIIIHLITLAFFIEMLRRILYRSREYPMDETKESLPFGLIRLRHIIIICILVYILWIIFTLWLYNLFMIGGLGSASSTFMNNSNLNL